MVTRWVNFLDPCATAVPNGFTGLSTHCRSSAAYSEALVLRIASHDWHLRVGRWRCQGRVDLMPVARTGAFVLLYAETREENMIHHLSIAARDPKRAAEVLAALHERIRDAVLTQPREASSRCNLTNTGPEWRSIRRERKLQRGGVTGGTFVQEGHAPQCLVLQSRPIPCDRGLGRK